MSMGASDRVPVNGCPVDTGWFRRELERERQFRLEQLISLSYATDASAGLTEVRAVLMAGARRALTEIDAALFRLSHGTFGLCELCGRPIPIHRLSAIPAVRLCLPCERSQTSDDASHDQHAV